MHSLEVKVDPIWKVIGDIKKKITESMQENGLKNSLVDFTNIVASELLENAIKYGIENKDLSKVGLEFELNERHIEIKVRNGISESEDLQEFIRIMKRIQSSENALQLYIARLKEIIENPNTEKSQLGLYRIASESSFVLNYRIEDNTLEVIATRTFQEQL